MLGQITVTGEAPSAFGPDESIVAEESTTGTKTPTAILDIPAAVSVITEDEMRKRGVDNLQDALSYTAGVLVDEFGSDDRYDYFRIRGFDETALGTYRDGLSARIPAWFTASRREPYAFQRIEVLKGSTSTLFGLNAPGGLVNAITKRPLETRHAEVYSTLGKDHVEFGTDFGGPVDTEGRWRYRLTALWQDADQGWDESNDDRLYIAPALTFTPNGNTFVTFLTNYSKYNGTGAHGIPEGTDFDPTSFFGEPDYNRFDTEETSNAYLFEHGFAPGVTLRQNARYTTLDLDYEEVYGGGLAADVPREAFATYGDSNRFAIDTQLEIDRSLAWARSRALLGFDYTYDNTHEDIRYGYAGGIDFDDPDYCGRDCVFPGPYVDWRVKQKALGLYAQEELTVAERWIVTLGGRYDHVNTVSEYLDTGREDDVTAEAFTGRAGITWKVTPNASAYANYAQSFQPLVSPTGNGYSSSSFDPQEGEQYEVGFKYRQDGLNALFTLALFDLTQSNVPTEVSPGIQRQIGETNVKGLEFEGKMGLADGLDMTLAYSYWNAEITGDGNGTVVGNRPPRVPEHMASAWIDYTLPARDRMGPLNLGGGVRYVGSSYGDIANTTRIDGYVVVDAAATYGVTENVSLEVSAKNIFDREYETTCYYGTCYYGDGRTALATLRYTW